MSVPNRGERCYLRDWRNLRFNELTHSQYELLRNDPLYIIKVGQRSSKISVKPDANQGWFVDNRLIMNELEHYKWRKANGWRESDGLPLEC